MTTFFVPGIPAPGGSKKAFVIPHTNRAVVVEAGVRNKEWRSAVALAASDHFTEPLRTAVVLRCEFVFPRPKSHYGSGKNASTLKQSAPSFHVSKPDTTKLLRSTEDALKAIAWVDDSQVVNQIATKRYGPRPGCLITIEALSELAVAEPLNLQPEPLPLFATQETR